MTGNDERPWGACLIYVVVVVALFFAARAADSYSRRGEATPKPSVTTQPAPTFTFTYTPPPNYGFTVCADGWVSHSTGRGTCSHHGGER